VISLVLYGRNDSYGYNLHKRAALSLNCMAEVLTDPDDEILFVDYNTPDDYPTFPEAIQDTLTETCLRRLRVLRVRPHHHRRFRERTHLVALEPIARNVAVRRSNPANRWILSTNTDMIFVMRGAASLSEHARDLPDGFYHTPRFEIPESLWETQPRSRPADVLAQIAEWGRRFHLNEVVRSTDTIRYDAPGDFQLILREDLFELAGFDERMLIGWHVDSNISKRLLLKHGAVGDMLPYVLGYHCDHTRQVTPAHRADRVENSIATFVDDVTESRIAAQAETWGLADETIEEIDVVASSRRYVAGLERAIGTAMEGLPAIDYDTEHFDRVAFDPSHVLPFLADIFPSYPRTTTIGWFGCRADLLAQFCDFWRTLGGATRVLVGDACPGLPAPQPEGAVAAPAEAIAAQADLFVFEFGRAARDATGASAAPDDLRALRAVSLALRQVGHVEGARIAGGGEPRRMVAVNVVNNRYEPLVRHWIAAAQSPMGTRVRQGFMRPPPPAPWALLAGMRIGPAGTRDGALVRAVPGRAGAVVFGPHLDLAAGAYRVDMSFTPFALSGTTGALTVEVGAGPYVLAHRFVTPEQAAAGRLSIDFRWALDRDQVAESLLDVRIVTDGSIAFVLESVSLAPAEAGGDADSDLIALMRATDPGEAVLEQGRVVAIRAPAGRAGRVCYGPYGFFAPGDHVVTLSVMPEGGTPDGLAATMSVEVVGQAERVLGMRRFHGHDIPRRRLSVPFRVGIDEVTQFRAWNSGACGFRIVSVTVAPAASGGTERDTAAPAAAEPLLPTMSVGGAGRRDANGAVTAIAGTEGHVVFGPYLDVPDGAYVLTVSLRDLSKAPARPIEIEVADGDAVLARCSVPTDARRAVETTLPVLVEGDARRSGPRALEIRVWSDGTTSFAVAAVTLSA
jgi:hypothetical protein